MKKKGIVRVVSVFVLVSVLAILPIMVACAKPAPKAEVFPSKSIKHLICGLSGDAFDTVGRAISPKLSQKLGVSVLPMNVKGAMNVDFFYALYEAVPDGYTIGFTPGWEWMYYIVKPGGPIKFDITKLPVVLAITTYPDCVFASAKSKLGIKTAEQLLKTKEPIRVADYAGLTPGAVALKIAGKGLDIRPVVLESYPEAHAATMRGDVDILTATPSGTTLKWARSGDYIPLFVWGKERFVNLPDKPCSRELGLPAELENVMLRRLFQTPPGTPKERMAKLAEGIKATLTDPEVVEWGKKAEQPLTFESGEECFKVIASIADFYQKRSADIKEFLK